MAGWVSCARAPSSEWRGTPASRPSAAAPRRSCLRKLPSGFEDMTMDAANRLRISLDDKYTADQGRIYLTGVQALVRLPMVQRRADRAARLNTSGFVSGYRGSPLGTYDRELWAARQHLDRENILFQPGLNEDLAATSVWGSQQVGLSPGATCDGVFAVWYAKSPGVDRSGDVLKHANAAGTAPFGGVLPTAGG